MAEVEEMFDKLIDKLENNNMMCVYKEMNNTALEKYFNKFSKKQIKKQSQDVIIDEVIKIVQNLAEEVPFNLLKKKMNNEDFCLQAAFISKIIQEIE